MSSEFDPILELVVIRESYLEADQPGPAETVLELMRRWRELESENADLRVRVAELSSGRSRAARNDSPTLSPTRVAAQSKRQSTSQSTSQSNGLSRQSTSQSKRQSSALDREVDRREPPILLSLSSDLQDPESASECRDQDHDLSASRARETQSNASVQAGGPTLDREVDRHESSTVDREVDCDLDCDLDREVDRDPDRDLRVAMIGAWDGLGGQHTSGTNRRRISRMIPLVRRLAERDGVEPAALWSAAVARFKADDEVRRKRLGLAVLCSQLEQWTYDAPPKKPDGGGDNGATAPAYRQPFPPLDGSP